MLGELPTKGEGQVRACLLFQGFIKVMIEPHRTRQVERGTREGRRGDSEKDEGNGEMRKAWSVI